MGGLTDHGRTTIETLAARHGLSTTAVEQMASALVRGGGTMAQFSIPELGGSGQWMAGGMTMVGDMFNSGLKMRVESLCADLVSALASGPLYARPQTLAGAAWWPEDLGQPASVGGQNQMRYAYFPQARRIAFDPGNGGAVILLDTQDHQIGGFSQQQSGPGDLFQGISFSSQFGQFALASLPRAGAAASGETPRTGQQSGMGQSQSGAPAATQSQSQGGGQMAFTPAPPASRSDIPDTQVEEAAAPIAETPAATQPAAASMPSATKPKAASSAEEIFSMIEKLAALKEAGILTDQEFSDKKAELLARL